MPGSTTFVFLTAVALTAGGIYIYKSRQSQPNNEIRPAARTSTSEQDSDESEHFYKTPDDMWNAINIYLKKKALNEKQQR